MSSDFKILIGVKLPILVLLGLLSPLGFMPFEGKYTSTTVSVMWFLAFLMCPKFSMMKIMKDIKNRQIILISTMGSGVAIMFGSSSPLMVRFPVAIIFLSAALMLSILAVRLNHWLFPRY